MTLFTKCIWVVILISTIVSCKVQQPIVDNNEKLHRRRTQELMHALDSIAIQSPKYFYSKIKTTYTDSNRVNNFKTSIRMTRDSAVSATISFAGIPIINSLITKDTFVMTNKKDRCFSKHDLSYFRDAFGVDFTYKNIEQLFLGLPIDYDTTQRYFQIHDAKAYMISSHKKLQERRIERKAKDDYIIKYFLNDSINQLNSMEIISPSDSTTIKVNFLKTQLINGMRFPEELVINILTPRNNILVELTYDKIEVNLPHQLEIVLPESYGKCD